MHKYAILQAMKTVLSSPSKRFSIVDLAKEAELAPSAAKYSLDYMLEIGLVKDEKVGRTHQCQANLDNYLTRQWKILFSLEDLHNAKTIENILKTGKKVMSIVLYGSTAIGKDGDLSDFDILVIADTDSEGKKKILSQAMGTKRETNITVYTPAEWRKKASIQKAFYETVIIDSITLYGEKPVVL